jgi:hypothetical protein
VCVVTRRFNGGLDSFESSPFATLSRGALSSSSLVTPMFGIELPSLPVVQQGVLTIVFVASMATRSLIGSRRPLLGLLLLPICFFGIMCLACWWVVAKV